MPTPSDKLPYSYEDYALAARILEAIPEALGMRLSDWVCDSPGSEACVEARHCCHDVMVAVATLVAPADRDLAPLRALQALVDKLDAVHADPQMQSIWILAHIHGYSYTGPTYSVELAAARDALALASRGDHQP